MQGTHTSAKRQEAQRSSQRETLAQGPRGRTSEGQPKNLHVGASVLPLRQGSEWIRPIGRVQIRSGRDGVLSVGRRLAAVTPGQVVVLKVVVPEKTRAGMHNYFQPQSPDSDTAPRLSKFGVVGWAGSDLFNLMRRIIEARSVTFPWSLLKI